MKIPTAGRLYEHVSTASRSFLQCLLHRTFLSPMYSTEFNSQHAKIVLYLKMNRVLDELE